MTMIEQAITAILVATFVASFAVMLCAATLGAMFLAAVGQVCYLARRWWNGD